MSSVSSPIIIIPARLAATRLPNKPLADIAGLPMIVQVLRRAREADVGPVLVAAADREIHDAVRDHGGLSVLTDPAHPSGSDRIYEALCLFDPDGRHDVVINLQGDLPTIRPESVAASLIPLRHAGPDIATLVAEISDEAERINPNVVKAVCAFGDGKHHARALYFSRATVPANAGPHYHHIGLYAYRRDALARFVALPPGLLERREKLEQLRALEAGMRIDAVLVDEVPLGVDAPEDLERARSMLKL